MIDEATRLCGEGKTPQEITESLTKTVGRALTLLNDEDFRETVTH